MEARCATDGHCWHVTSTLTVNPPITVRQCCWCGDERHDQEQRHPQREHGTRVLLPRTFDGSVFDNGMTDTELAAGRKPSSAIPRSEAQERDIR